MVSAEPMLSDVPAQRGESMPLAGPSPKKARLEPPGAGTALNWDRHLTQEAKLRTQPTLRKLVTGSVGKPGVAGLHGGLPHPSIFPLEGITLNLKGGATLTIDDPHTVRTRHSLGDCSLCVPGSPLMHMDRTECFSSVKGRFLVTLHSLVATYQAQHFFVGQAL